MTSSCSWNSYIDVLIAYGGRGTRTAIHKGCVIGLDGTKWTGNSHPYLLQPSIIECKIIAHCFSAENFEPLYTGVKIESQLYRLEKNESSQPIYCSGQWNGIVMQVTHKAIVVGTCTKSGKEAAKTAVTYLVDYMKSYDC